MEKMMSKKYQVGVTIYNSFEVEADSVEDAEIQVREMDLYDTFEHCDYNITYVDEVKDTDIPKEMCQDLLDRIKKRDDSYALSMESKPKYAPATKEAVEQKNRDE